MPEKPFLDDCTYSSLNSKSISTLRRSITVAQQGGLGTAILGSMTKPLHEKLMQGRFVFHFKGIEIHRLPFCFVGYAYSARLCRYISGKKRLSMQDRSQWA